MPDNSRVQFGFQFINPKTGGAVTNRAQQIRAMKKFFDSGGTEQLKTVKVVARWRNPEDSGTRAQMWKTTEDPGQTLDEFYDTFHGSTGPLAAAEVIVEREYASLARSSSVSGKKKTSRPKGRRK